MKKSVLCILLALAVLIGSVGLGALSASARDNDVAAVSYYSGDYEYEYADDNTVIITDYSGSDSNLTIPSTLDGDTVTCIGESAFWGTDSLKAVKIPDTVTSIGKYAFQECTKLRKVTLGKSVERIETYAFEYCTALSDITFPDSLISIGSLAFSDTKWLKNQPYGLVYAGKVLYDDYYSDAVDVVIEPGTKGIAEKAFNECKTLKSVVIPDSVVNIGDWAFDGCTSLESVNIPSSVTNIGEGTFRSCKALPGIDIPDTVTKIGDQAFDSCSSLKNIVIPDSVTDIGRIAFSGCKSLTEINIPASVIFIRENAFRDCSALNKLTVDKSNEFYDSRNNCNAIIDSETDTLLRGCAKTKIPSTVKAIGSTAFSSCNTIKSFTIPDTITEIGNSAFHSCKALTEITIPDSVDSIFGSAFYGCTSLKSVTIPASVTYIGNEAFGYYEALDWTGLYNTQRMTDFTITGYNDTEAQKYADDNLLKFVSLGEKPTEPPVLLGDADGNGEVDLVDATVIQRHTTMIAVPYDESQLMCADIDGDGDLTIVDATFIQRYATHIMTPYKIGEAVD